MSPNWIIYALRLPDTQEYRYVGYTSKGAAHRLKQHIRDALAGVNHKKYKWMRKHGPGQIVIDILETCPPGEWGYLNYAERYWIDALVGFGHRLLNGTPGGVGGRGSKHSEETRAKMRASAPRTSGPDHHMYGVKQTDEHIQKRFAKFAETRWTPEAREAQRQRWIDDNPMNQVDFSGEKNPFFGQKHSEETRAKMSKPRKPTDGYHIRWHVRRGITKDGCVYCVM